MNKITVDDVEPTPSAGEAVRRGLGDALGTTDVAINHYRLEPGERISGLHAHGDQEEVFVVVEGTVTFETLDGVVTVGTSETGEVDQASEPDQGSEPGEASERGEAIRFAPGEYQSGTNAGEETAVVYALGAPPDSGDVRIPLPCPECDHAFVRPALADDGETPVLACSDCGTESAVECPECGGADLTATLDDEGERPVSRCRDCGATFEGV